ncbi:hypothetical protein HNR42_001320 [Deinobacterium chartae]|uniref:Uncharacterized protein n=1 Tax=Deinobacterium chartae TaxID=521158 RepID=A0A841HWX1_9DEIO|nr:hypothetical protein [Deinobacterium chartae]MBB6097897.1 hypothetical protein [Deinobacterium chartae]
MSHQSIHLQPENILGVEGLLSAEGDDAGYRVLLQHPDLEEDLHWDLTDTSPLHPRAEDQAVRTRLHAPLGVYDLHFEAGAVDKIRRAVEAIAEQAERADREA